VEGSTANTWSSVLDFFVQNVCLDGQGKFLIGVAPIDGNPACVAQRDLQPGERIPYYIAMTVPRWSRLQNPRGEIRGANFPYSVPTLKYPVVLRLFDSRKNGGAYGVRDYGDTAIRTLWTQSENTISISGVFDYSGPILYNGPNCKQNVAEPAARLDAGVVVDRTVLSQPSNRFVYPTLARQRRSWQVEPCTASRGMAQVEWELVQVSYLTQFGESRTKPLLSLVSHPVPKNNQGHVEKTYYTRELGYTRWEGWERLDGLAPEQKAVLIRRAKRTHDGASCADLSRSSSGLTLSEPPGPGEWVTAACFEMANILPPDDPLRGDYPTDWIERGKHVPLFAPLFKAEPEVHTITLKEVSPQAAAPGERVVLKGTGFGQKNTVQLGHRVASGVTPGADQGTEISFLIPEWARSGDTELSVYNDDVIAHTNSVKFTVLPARSQ
jgi:hypothetical protein